MRWYGVVVRALPLCALALAACGAHRHAGATAAYDLSYRRAVAGDAAVGGIVTGSAKLRLFTGPSRPGSAFGFDLALGFAHPGGFAGRGAVYPVGAASAIGSRGVIGVVGGVGVSGVTGRIPPALEVPAEAFATLRFGATTAVHTWVQPAWLPFASRGPELRAGLTIRYGGAFHHWGFDGGGGYHLGVVYTHEVDAHFIGVAAGYDFDVSTR